VSLSNQPSSPAPPGCTSMGAFAISSALDATKRQNMLAQALTAQATRMALNVTWDDAGGCVSYDGSAFPLIVRLTPMS